MFDAHSALVRSVQYVLFLRNNGDTLMAKHTARIENWIKVANCLLGNVTEHTLREFDSDNCQLTSDLVSFHPEQGVAETQNTHYTLGVELKR